GSGDVKYHIGAKGTHKTKNGHTIDIELMSNPSHLESVNPVVEGAARATEDCMNGDEKRKKVLPVLIHGDASFNGQGVVAESLNMDRKSTRLNSSHVSLSYAVFCLHTKKQA